MPQFVYNSETEISVGRIFSLGSGQTENSPADGSPRSSASSSPKMNPQQSTSVISMSTLGQLGRFGNQVLQYMSLTALCQANGAEPRVPAWIGQSVFGLDDSEPSQQLPSLVESPKSKSNSSFGTMYLDHALHKTPAGATITMPELSCANPEAVNRDLVGWFQGNTRNLAPHKQLLQGKFTPVPALKAELDSIVKLVRSRGNTLVVLHLRIGDYKNIPLTSFGYIAPVEWYMAWLRAILPLLDSPVVYVASDDLDAVMPQLRQFGAICEKDILPDGPGASLKASNAGFLVDYYMIQNADVAAISNSTFSFTACMFNKMEGARFYRPHWDDGLVPFDPWMSFPILHRPGKLIGTLLPSMATVLKTQGVAGLLSNLLYEVPTFYARVLTMNTVLAFRRWGRGGVAN